MATAAVAHAALRFGMKFSPTPKDAVDFYLRRWVLGQPLPDTAGVILDARVYGSEPKDLDAAFPRLPGTHDRFFTTCKRQKAGRGHRISRTAGAGGWISNAKKVVENDAGEKIGFRENLHCSYKDKSRESDWLMEEYHLCGLDQFAIGGWAVRPSWYPSEPLAFPSAPPPQHHAAISPRKSNPPLTKDMDDFARSLEADLDMAADQSTIQQGGHQSTIQEEASDDEPASGSESHPPEVDMSDLLSWFDSAAEELPETTEHVQDEQDSQPEREHEHTRSLDGLVADERGDDVIAEDLFDALDSIGNGDDLISDSGDKDDWLNLPLSAYNDIMY